VLFAETLYINVQGSNFVPKINSFCGIARTLTFKKQRDALLMPPLNRQTKQDFLEKKSAPLPAVRAFTPWGKTVVKVLEGALSVLGRVRGKAWAQPPLFFHDDPRRYTTSDVLYFAYKYYFSAPETDDSAGAVRQTLLENPPKIEKPLDFIEKSRLTITAAGDLMPYEWIQKPFCQHLWDDIAPHFFDADIRFANLETPVDTRQAPTLVPEVMLNDMHFNASEEIFDIFVPPRYATADNQPCFDVLATANNHSLDGGETGLVATRAFLEKKNIAATGTARTPEERLNFPVLERNGIRVAFVAYTFSMNQFTNPPDKPWLVNHLEVNQPEIDLMPLKKDVFYAKQVLKADFVVLSLHYGNAYQAYPGAHIVANTQRIFAECGPDIILGGHPHNVQPMAQFGFVCPISRQAKKGFVLFSFGDFVAYDIFNWCHLSVYLKLEVSKGLLMNPETKTAEETTLLTHLEVVPVYMNGQYKSKNNRDLRFCNALKLKAELEKGRIPDFMTDWNVQEFTSLMAFYERHFCLNFSH
jgi:hypothetical protein